MLRSSRTASHGSLILFQAPSRRHRMARRRSAAIATVAALAATSALVGALMSRGAEDPAAQAGLLKSPLSYLPL
jgi:hypothetical protein